MPPPNPVQPMNTNKPSRRASEMRGAGGMGAGLWRFLC
jgi:hypothetical protein